MRGKDERKKRKNKDEYDTMWLEKKRNNRLEKEDSEN